MLWCAHFNLKGPVFFLTINGLQLCFLVFLLTDMMRWYVCEVPFYFFYSVVFHLGVWRSSQVVFVMIFVLLQLCFIVLMWCHWVKLAWWNQFPVHKILAIPLFVWVLWCHMFWVLGYFRVSCHIVFWLRGLLQCACVVGLLDFLVLYVGTCVILFQFIHSCWYQLFYLCSYSLVKWCKINFCCSLQLTPLRFLWAFLSGILRLPFLCTQFPYHQQQAQILLGEGCGAIVLECVSFGKNIFFKWFCE